MSFDGNLAEIIRAALSRATESLSHTQIKEVCTRHGVTEATFLCTLTELVQTGQVTKGRKAVGHGMLRRMTDCYSLALVAA